MSGKGALELDAPQPQQPQRRDEVGPRDRQFYVGDPIPYVLTKAELAAFLGLSFWAIDRCRVSHSHPGIKQLEGPGHPRFCGRTLKAWLENTIDAPARRQFFASASSASATRRRG